MRSTPVRRSQLVTPFGVGSMLVSPDGVSMMPTGLDFWFDRGDEATIDPTEFRIEEWRLQRHLGVSHFMLPPDFRESWGYSSVVPNTGLTIPCVRFPQWHFCSQASCRALLERPLSVPGRLPCTVCAANGRRGWLSQVPFVAVCEAGHIQDFPWIEWVHRDRNPSCGGQLTLQATGGASLGGQEVRCTCKASRTLLGITEASGGTTLLSRSLASDGQPFLCQGKSPWHGDSKGEGCSLPLKGSLKSASNVYFSVLRSSIYLPRQSQSAPAELVSALEAPQISVFLNALNDAGRIPDAKDVRAVSGNELIEYSDDQIDHAVAIYLRKVEPEVPAMEREVASDNRETQFRRAEYMVLREPQVQSQLETWGVPINDYGSWMSTYFDRVMLVDKLRETRAMVGFERINPQPQADFDALKKLLRQRAPSDFRDDWLPAYVVFGEGIYLELSAERIHQWESDVEVVTRANALIQNYSRQLESRGRDSSEIIASINPRFIAIHTLSHVLINRLIFDSGYSAASLKERLYVSSDVDNPMAGLLIYTAAGDSEGTLGGLVRMGKPERLGSAVKRAIDESRWCSSDPVCMEVGDHGGQGPDSCNLAACHNCGLVPETTCESFNRFLDRGLLSGTITSPYMGYFKE